MRETRRSAPLHPDGILSGILRSLHMTPDQPGVRATNRLFDDWGGLQGFFELAFGRRMRANAVLLDSRVPPSRVSLDCVLDSLCGLDVHRHDLDAAAYVVSWEETFFSRHQKSQVFAASPKLYQRMLADGREFISQARGIPHADLCAVFPHVNWRDEKELTQAMNRLHAGVSAPYLEAVLAVPTGHRHMDWWEAETLLEMQERRVPVECLTAFWDRPDELVALVESGVPSEYILALAFAE